MKKIWMTLLVACALSQLYAQTIEGSWTGKLNAMGGDLDFVYNISKTSDTSYSATLDIPAQMAFGVPCEKIYFVKDSIYLKTTNLNIKFKGLWNGHDSISGTYQQGLLQSALNLKRLLRPQTPKPPFNYYSEDVEYDNADKSLHYGATFTRPSGSGKYPAVIIITGSGTQDRDGTLFGHKLYWVLADYLTRHGIAVLRVDDRGAGKSTTGDIKNATTFDFSHDVETSLNYLETRSDVNKKHIGLIGHSEGGIIAPMVAARRKDVSFIVLWGAPELGGLKANVEQNVHRLRQLGINEVAISAFTDVYTQILNQFTKVSSEAQLDTVIVPIFTTWKKTQSKATLDALYVHDNSIIGQSIFSISHILYGTPWLRFFITYNPEQDLAKVSCPVLAVNGAKDTQVNPVENLAAIKKVLTQNGNKDFKTIELPGLNHLLQDAQTGDLAEYETNEETMSPAALNIICSWIKLHTK